MSDTQTQTAPPPASQKTESGAHQSANEHTVLQASDLEPSQRKIVRISNHEIGIYNIGGTFYAVHSMCPHQFGPACAGPTSGESVCDESTGWHLQLTRPGEILVCPWHGMQFDILTGQCLSDKKKRVRTFPVRVVDGEVRVQIGGRRASSAG